MVPQLVIVEDDAELLDFYKEGFRDVGFVDIVAIQNTVNVVDEIAQCYRKPTLLLSDYYVHPYPPSHFLPALRRRRIEIPAVIVSGRIRAEQINELTLTYPVRGFFEKPAKISTLIADVSKHLMDLSPEASITWQAYVLRADIDRFLEKRTPPECAALYRLMGFDEVKVISADVDLGLNPVYALRKEMIGFLGSANFPERYYALAMALRERLETVATV